MKTALRRTLLGVGLGTMLFQIGLLRELRYQLSAYYTLAPFLFSAVIVLLGLGSLLAGVFRKSGPAARVALLLLPMLLLPTYAVTVYVARSTIDRSAEMNYALSTGNDPRLEHLDAIAWPFVLTALVGYGIVFVLQGFLFATLFREGRKSGTLSGAYAADLFASGVGALIGGFAAFKLEPGQTAGLGTAALLATVFWVRGPLILGKIPVAIATIVTLIGGGLFFGTDVAHLHDPPQLHGYEHLHAEWSPYRRIDVLEQGESVLVMTDGLVFHVYRKTEDHAWNPISIVMDEIPRPESGEPAEVLIIGAGTGSDVRILRDMRGDSARITAVELDEGFIRTSRAVPFLSDGFTDAEVVVSEGRHYLESTPRDFDAIIFAYIDPQSAVSRIGVPDANFLYTVEGLKAAWGRLREGGILVVTRVYLVSEQDAFLKRLFATLEEADLKEHSAVQRLVRSFRYGYYGEISIMQTYIRKNGPPPVIKNSELIPEPWQEGGRATTDAFPFSLETGVWFGILVDWLSGRKALKIGFAIAGLLLLLRLFTSRAHGAFFLLGFGSFMLESIVLMQSFLLLGNPTMSAALAVGALLIWNAVGSLCSDRLAAWKAFPYFAIVLIVVHLLTAPWVIAATIASSPALRMGSFALHLAIAGIPIGAMFPIALRYYRDRDVSSLFAIDLLGCALAPIAFWMAMGAMGIPLAGAMAAVCYLGVALLLRPRAVTA